MALWCVADEDTVRLSFYRGTIEIHGDYNVPHARWDSRSHCRRSEALHYRDIIDYLDQSEIPYHDEVLDLVACPTLRCSDINLRDYQQDALDRWLLDRRGVIVLPTGSGKTVIALKAIEAVDAPTLIVVPTLDLVDQWKQQLQVFDSDIGEYTGREKTLEAITVSTYDTAYNVAEHLGNQFKLLVFDEVHHLPSEGYRHIAEFFAAPYRLGLTATYEREDGLHSQLTRLLGGKVYEMEVEELTGEHLSSYRVVTIYVDLTREEKEAYSRNMEIFQSYIRNSNITMRKPADFQKVVIRSGNDPRAWRAVRARNQARKIAYNSQAKMDELRELLRQHRDDRIIIFTRYNDLVYRIAKQHFIPCITHTTHKNERQELLEGFRTGRYNALVSSQVLDEGIDVPDANIGIIMSGTGSSREYIQRLGRILRPTDSDEDAILYEIVSSKTAETRTSYRRKQKQKQKQNTKKTSQKEATER